MLVETEASYIEAVTRTVQWLLVHDAGLREDGLAVDRSTVREWKLIGSWNDDWDLSDAMYRWLMAAPGATTTERRRSALPASAAARMDLEGLRAAAGERAARTWEEVRGVFEEIYNGSSVAVERYGVTARVHEEHGLAETEHILASEELFHALGTLGIKKIAIVTGRSLVDWRAVAKRMPLPPSVAVATMEDGRKPDPAPLLKVVGELRPRAFFAVGDTRADLELVRRWNATDEGLRVPGTAVMLCPAEDEPAYRDLGATLFIHSLAELPALLRRASSPPAIP